MSESRYDLAMLDPIIETTRVRVEALRGREPELQRAAADAGPVRSLADALSAPGLSVIAEIKRRSPSAGDIRGDLDPVHRAHAYEQGGAAAISVLTEPDFFSGSLSDLEMVRGAVTVPVLRKDFVLDPVQVWEARAAGADAVLLIVAVLDRKALEECLAVSAAAGLEALVEVHTGPEAEVACDAGARIVGVNNRNLSTFRTDLSVAERLRKLLTENTVTVAESGIAQPADAARMAAAGYDAVLVGEALVRATDPGALVSALRRPTR
jgi:indole-3-glycerol phosphate synthase